MKVYIIAIILLLSLEHLYAEPLFYFSPGISIAWGKQTVVYGWKVSIGNYYDPINSNIDGYFVNWTIGLNYGPDNPDYTYLYSEIESGIQTGALFSGAGFGLAFVNIDGSTVHIMPKGALFTGFFTFLRSDIIVYKKRLIYTIGGNTVIPFCKLL